MKELRTIDADGAQHTFFYEVNVELNHPRKWHFHVWRTDPPRTQEDCYQATFEELDDSTVQSTLLHNFGQWGRRKGISESLFDEAFRSLGRQIVSSRRWVDGTAERQSDLARRMWERFVANGRARFDAERQRYVYLPPDEP